MEWTSYSGKRPTFASWVETIWRPWAHGLCPAVGFRETDGEGQPPVVIINEALARREFAEMDPIGEIVSLGTQRSVPLEIVGVVSSIRQQGLDRAPMPQYFIDFRQIPMDGAFRAPPLFPLGADDSVRTSADMAALVGQIRSVVRQMDSQATVDNVATMEDILSNSLARPWISRCSWASLRP